MQLLDVVSAGIPTVAHCWSRRRSAGAMAASLRCSPGESIDSPARQASGTWTGNPNPAAPTEQRWRSRTKKEGKGMAAGKTVQRDQITEAADFCELPLDTNTAHRKLKLSDNNRTVTLVREDLPYPDNPERFDFWFQVLCRNGLTGRCYWEVQRRGWVDISVSYIGIKRRGNSDDCEFGCNDQSWSLRCSVDGSYSVWHNKIEKVLPLTSGDSDRVRVCLDSPAGSLSFYIVNSDLPIHLHTFNTTFTQPLYPGFMVRSIGSSMSLCCL
ncbi:stonustoxin subunit beta-like [Perca fluviatilis]|uniref:stonustoxin subunit beta-like n=1 Tax=Perca fluviatilis TaxID=8168 RepID=UPI0019666135|nr:stonustoxin subunit beta-like [Perca fluviatilis]